VPKPGLPIVRYRNIQKPNPIHGFYPPQVTPFARVNWKVQKLWVQVWVLQVKPALHYPCQPYWDHSQSSRKGVSSTCSCFKLGLPLTLSTYIQSSWCWLQSNNPSAIPNHTRGPLLAIRTGLMMRNTRSRRILDSKILPI